MNGIKKARPALATVNSNTGATALSHAIGKKIGLVDYFTCLIIDDDTGAPVARSRNKAVVKATRIGSDYESLLVSIKSIVLAIENSDIKHLVHGRKVLIFPSPEWQGQPRNLIDFGSDELTLGGDYVVLQNVDRGIFLKVDREKVAEPPEQIAAEVTTGPVQEVKEGTAVLDENYVQETSAAAEAMQADIRQDTAQKMPVPPLVPECQGRIRYFQLMADFPEDFPKKTGNETTQDYFVRVSTVLTLQPSIQEVFPDLCAWGRRSSRFEVLQASHIIGHICKKRLAGTSATKLGSEFNISQAHFSKFTTIYDHWRKAIEVQQDKHEDIKSDVWLVHDCKTIHALMSILKKRAAEVV